jgi:SAM-dependent methyltransferase
VNRTIIEGHYRRIGGRYDQMLYYSEQFIRHLSSNMIEQLRLTESDVFVDLGGGTGMYSIDILEQVPLQTPVTLVDPFPEMLAQVPTNLPIRPVQMDALAFSSRPGLYDKILIKEAVHHVDEPGRLFHNLFDRLSPGGILLLVHVPPRIKYPLFGAALRRAETWHADPDNLVGLLTLAGFDVKRAQIEYEHVLPKQKYFRMVANRYMSLLSSFDDEELEAGLVEMNETYTDRHVLEFADRFDYLAATKP